MFSNRIQERTNDRPTSRTARPEFDFGDGPVRAARHRNPDGSEGGWVADTAHVDETASVSPEARVYGNARVFGDAELRGAAQVFDTARVGDGAVIADRARVSGSATVADATVSGHARVTDAAQISHGAIVTDRARITHEARVRSGFVGGRVIVRDRAWVAGAEIDGELVLDGSTVLRAEDAPTKVVSRPAPARRTSTARPSAWREVEDDVVDLTETIDALAVRSLDLGGIDDLEDLTTLDDADALV